MKHYLCIFKKGAVKLSAHRQNLLFVKVWLIYNKRNIAKPVNAGKTIRNNNCPKLLQKQNSSLYFSAIDNQLSEAPYVKLKRGSLVNCLIVSGLTGSGIDPIIAPPINSTRMRETKTIIFLVIISTMDIIILNLRGIDFEN
jgi:hypothetical protein